MARLHGLLWHAEPTCATKKICLLKLPVLAECAWRVLSLPPAPCNPGVYIAVLASFAISPVLSMTYVAALPEKPGSEFWGPTPSKTQMQTFFETRCT